jgi:transcriptional regulator with XRE-family HTH domain
METIGEKLRELREGKGLLLRQVATELEIDPSLLSRIERGDKLPTRNQIVFLEKMYGTKPNELLVLYLCDRLLSELEGEDEVALKVMQVTEKKVSYLVKNKHAKA